MCATGEKEISTRILQLPMQIARKLNLKAISSVRTIFYEVARGLGDEFQLPFI